ncbi:PadR family transcriptional regulator [Nocardiopsis coralliicola]
MAHAILGLLLIAPQSLYDLVKSFESGVSLFYSASSGSIKRALDALLERGAIEVEREEPGARRRKVYRATDAGRAEFREWMLGEPAGPDAEAAALPRLFFLGLLEPGERAPVLQAATARFEADLDRLTAVAHRIEGLEVPDRHREVLAYQLRTLDYGLAAHRFALDWFRARAEEEAAAEADRAAAAPHGAGPR